MYYFFKEDLEELDNEIERVHNKLEKTKEELTQIYARKDVGLETNSAYNVLLIMHKLLGKQIDELSQIRNRSTTLWKLSPKNEGILIGDTVVIQNLTDDKEITLDIRSYWICNNANNRVAYSAPLPELILDAKVGETREGFISGVHKTYKIKKIN